MAANTSGAVPNSRPSSISFRRLGVSRLTLLTEAEAATLDELVKGATIHEDDVLPDDVTFWLVPAVPVTPMVLGPSPAQRFEI